MALTRRMLKAMGIEEEKIDEIIAAHSDTVDALKEQRDEFKESADKLEKVQKELDEMKAAAENADESEWKAKYEKEHSDFAAFKSEQAEKETATAKADAYKQLLKDAGVSEKRIDSIIKVTDLSEINLKDGKLEDSDKLTESIKTNWSDFITTSQAVGTDTTTPPENSGTKVYTSDQIRSMTAAEINANWNDIKSSLKN